MFRVEAPRRLRRLASRSRSSPSSCRHSQLDHATISCRTWRLLMTSSTPIPTRCTILRTLCWYCTNTPPPDSRAPYMELPISDWRVSFACSSVVCSCVQELGEAEQLSRSSVEPASVAGSFNHHRRTTDLLHFRRIYGHVKRSMPVLRSLCAEPACPIPADTPIRLRTAITAIDDARKVYETSSPWHTTSSATTTRSSSESDLQAKTSKRHAPSRAASTQSFGLYRVGNR